MGTLDYMAPEQGGDTHNVDIRADIYSLGASLYRLLTGQVIYHGEQYSTPVQKIVALATKPAPPVQDRRPEVPSELAEVVHHMLEKLPDDRYQSPEEVAESLAPFCDGHNLAALLQRSEGDDQGSPETPSAGESVAIASPDVESEVTTVHASDISDAATVAPEVDVTIDTAKPLVPEIAQVKPLIDTGARTTGSSPASATARTKSKRAGIPPWMLIGGGVAALSLITFLGTLATIFFLQTPEGTLRVEINDPTIKVQLKGTDITFTQDKQEPIEIKPGNKTLVVTRGDFTFETNRFILKNGETTVVNVDLLPGKVQVVSNDRVLDERAIAGSTGEVVLDSSSNNHRGKIVGAKSGRVNAAETPDATTSPAVDNAGYALQINGGSKNPAPFTSHSVGLPPWKIVKDQDFTIDFWIRANGGNGQKLFVAEPYYLMTDTGRVVFAYNKPDYSVLKGGHIGEWAHVAVVVEGNEMRLYFNGRATGSLKVDEREDELPQMNFGGRMWGEIDEIRISSVARYHEDFTPSTRFSPDKATVALYHCDEGSGLEVKDSSGNGRHGKIPILDDKNTPLAVWIKADGPTRSIGAAVDGDQDTTRIEAAKEILASGGQVRIVVDGAEKEIKSPEDVPVKPFTVKNISFTRVEDFNSKLTPRIMVFSELSELWVCGQFTIADVEQLGRLPNLEWLILGKRGRFTAADLANVRGFARVKTLRLESEISKGKLNLANFKALEELTVSTSVSGVTGLAELPNLKSVSFFASDVTDEGLDFQTPPKQLEILRIDKCGHVTDACLIHIGRIKTLKQIAICNTKITRTGVESLRKQLPQCQINWGESYNDRIILPPLSEADKSDN